MQKSTKRLLSLLVVVAMALALAPSGLSFLAVETKAATGDTNWTAAEAEKGVTQAAVATEQAKQTAVVTVLNSLTGTTPEERLEELKEKLPTCPFCGQSTSNLQLAATSTNYGSTAAIPQHHFVSGELTKTAWEGWNMSVVGSKACVILDKDSTVFMKGRINLSQGSNIMNIGGLGTISGDMSGTSYDGTAGMIYVSGAGSKLNLYGGRIIMTGTPLSGTTYKGFYRPIIYLAHADATVNIWTDDVVIGPESAGTTAKCNVRPYKGTLNMYGGTIQNAYSSNGNQGWNVMMQETATFNMYGGTIKDGKGISTVNGGNVCLYAATNTFNMYGGTISGGKGTNGGNIAAVQAAGATVNIMGGNVQNGLAANGGNIAVTGGTLKVGGTAQITNGSNTAGYNSYGGNIYLLNTAAGTTIGGTISNGHSLNGSNIFMKGGNAEISATIGGGTGKLGDVFVTTDATYNEANVTFSGGSVSGTEFSNLNNHQNAYNANTMNGDVYIAAGAGVDGNGVNVTLKNGFDTGRIYFAKAGGKNSLTVDPSWSNAEIEFYSDTAYYCGGTIASASATELNGTLINKNGSPVQIVADGNGGLKLVDFEVIGADGRQGYANAADAVDAAKNDLTKHIVAADDITLNGETVVIDAIGDVHVAGNGTIYGIDSTNDSFAATSGKVTVDNGVIVEPEIDYRGNKHYIALTGGDNGSAYTFHRVEATLTNVTVNVDNAGLYYKAEYRFDETVKERIASYGVLVKLNEDVNKDNKANFTSSDDMTAYNEETHTLTASSHGVYGVFKTTNTDATNLENGQIKLYGNPYLAINTTGEAKEASEYPMFDATSVGMSMADAMLKANEKWTALDETAQGHLNTFVSTWKAAFSTELLEQLTNFTIA